MEIKRCILNDLDTIYKLYHDARVLQISKNMVAWPHFEKQFIKNEILNHQQWKIEIENELACNWSIHFNDKDIWGDKDQNNSIFIHRIVTNPEFRGSNFVKVIVDWAKDYASNHKRKYVRLDTLGNNTKLIEHYTKSGFNFLGMVKLTNTTNLPLHYQKEPNCCLFEIEL